jgi:hypothetical protein
MHGIVSSRWAWLAGSNIVFQIAVPIPWTHVRVPRDSLAKWMHFRADFQAVCHGIGVRRATKGSEAIWTIVSESIVVYVAEDNKLLATRACLV